MTAPVPPEAITAAMVEVPDVHLGFIGGWEPAISADCMRRALEAAAPVLRDHGATLLKAEIADEFTAIAAQTVLEAAAAERVIAVAETLRYLGHWGDTDRTPDALAQVAADLERGDLAEQTCCPVCQEIECDGDCPLRTARGTTIEPDPLADRVRQLEQLATDMLGRFTQTQDGYRARVGQVQVAKWGATLRGEQ